MAKYTNEQLMARYKTLPGELKEAILSVDTSKAIQEIGKKHGLAIDKLGVLADETSAVMLGFERADDFISNLARQLGVAGEKAAKIGEEINAAIFSKIRSSLREIQEREETPEAAPKKEDVLKEIERYEKSPGILEGKSAPEPVGEGVFEAKMEPGKEAGEKEVFRMPKEEANRETSGEEEKTSVPYSEGDPYREPLK